ncbi:tetratricopeptide repeat protein 38 family protein [Streptomyces albospinus]|uniref:Tetratricopeptide repeat protein 38 n=1 Tax=Streptomyces albospinus TaxID=285515 RepID=A0ABQ2V683_9ACTN|nr:tetratricopeptide repeat protein [Streptomyces albospinus]GGU69906.1 tetratricopeptide repeat protein 38 family protein [Streptomyces albospinus]
MTVDRHGHAMTDTGAEALRHYEQALDDLLFFRPRITDTTQALLAAAPRSPIGQALAAYLGVLGTEEKGAAEAHQRFSRFRAGLDADRLTPRERMHVAAAAAWLDGDYRTAGRILGEIAVAHPRDLLALFAGHHHDFLTGDAQRLRDRVGGALDAWDADDPHRAPLLGMYAFGLEETGHYEYAEQVGRAALDRHPHDVWAIHGVVHTYEMRGRFADGIRFLDARTGDWSSGTLLTVHNWWHYALYALESGDTARVLDIYDSALHHDGSPGVAMELLDAAALLWRLYLAEDDQSTRWAALADAWERRADGPHYAFNDAHAVMAYVGAGRIDRARRLVRDRESWLAAKPAGANRAMTAEIGLPVCRALIAYGSRDYPAAADLLLPIRHRVHEFGGSHAQRDAVQRTLVEAALRADRPGLARTLLSERIHLRPICPYNWSAKARLEDRLGAPDRAAAARKRAAEQAAA